MECTSVHHNPAQHVDTLVRVVAHIAHRHTCQRMDARAQTACQGPDCTQHFLWGSVQECTQCIHRQQLQAPTPPTLTTWKLVSRCCVVSLAASAGARPMHPMTPRLADATYSFTSKASATCALRGTCASSRNAPQQHQGQTTLQPCHMAPLRAVQQYQGRRTLQPHVPWHCCELSERMSKCTHSSPRPGPITGHTAARDLRPSQVL